MRKVELLAKGKEKMAEGGGDKVSDAARAGFPMLGNPVHHDTHAELSKQAGLSKGTYHKAQVIIAKASDEVKQALRTGRAGFAEKQVMQQFVAQPDERRHKSLTPAGCVLKMAPHQHTQTTPDVYAHKVSSKVSFPIADL